MQFPWVMSEGVIGHLVVRSTSPVRQGWWNHAWLRPLASYLLLPNLLFAMLGQFVYVTRPLINVDYLLLGSVAALLPAPIVTLSYAALLANDAFVSLAPVFHFDLETALFSLTFGLGHRLVFSSLAILLVTSVSSVAFLSARLSGVRERAVAQPVLLVLAASIIALDVLGGTSALSRSDTARVRINIATSALYKTVGAVRRGLFFSPTAGMSKKAPSVPSATGGVRRALTAGRQSRALGAVNVVLVLVESLGHFLDGQGDAVVLAPLLSDSIRDRYEVRIGTVPAHGATTNGEFRELCGVDADYRSARLVDGSGCLPELLRKDGFRTFAVHGYSQTLFDRDQWYSRLGFQQTSFGEQLTRLPGVSLCGTTFRGACDADASRIVATELSEAPSGERRFVYWLTLSSHLPLDAAGGAGSTLNCEQSSEARRFADVCTLMRIHRLVAMDVAAIAMNPALPPTRFVVVGDHAPPFFSRDKRAIFSPDSVAFVELVPRGLELRTPTAAHVTSAAGTGGR